MIQYAAIGDLELVIKELATTTGRPVALVYDPKGGWCVTDEVKKGPSKHGSACPEYNVQTYQDWFSRTIGDAALVAFGVRFLPGTLVGRLFRKPTPYPEERAQTGTGELKDAKTDLHRQAGVATNKQAPKHQGQQVQGRSFGAPSKAGQSQQSNGRSGTQMHQAQRPNPSAMQQSTPRQIQHGHRNAEPAGQGSQVTRDGKLQPALQSERRPVQPWQGKRN